MYSESVMRRLFSRLFVIYPSFKSQVSSDEELVDFMSIWAEELEKRNISFDRIKIGLDRAIASQSDFLPGIGKFIGYCKPTPEELGLPSPDNAYEEACKNAHKQSDLMWSHEAVKDSAVKITLHRLKCEARMYTESSFKKHYAEIVEDFVDGNRLPKPTEQPQGPFKPRSGLDCPANRILKERGQESKFKDFEGDPSELIKAVTRNFTKTSK